MASQDGKAFKQDMLVSIRYRNDLPPPPMPPKLLEIDTGGLQQYLDPGFASGIVRREEPNIDVDAEGGMPIDMIGMYGYFEGDESAIMAPEFPQQLHPDDEALMLTPEQLRTGGVQKQGTTFLRKTQYMTASTAPTQEILRSTQTKTRKPVDKKAIPVAREDKENIKRNIQKGFDLAYPDSTDSRGASIPQADRTAWERPVHPQNKNLTPVQFFPVLPDLDAVTSVGNFHSIARFDKPPLPALHGRRDNRIDGAFFWSQERNDLMPEYEAARQAYEQDPKNFEHPGLEPMSKSLMLPKTSAAVTGLRTIFNDADPDKNSEDILSDVVDPSTSRVPLLRTRFYPSAKQELLSETNPRFMALSLYEPSKASSSSRLKGQGAAAYYYPIIQRIKLKAERGKMGGPGRQPLSEEDLLEEIPEQVMILPREPNDAELVQRYSTRAFTDSAFREQYEEIEKNAEAAKVAEEAEERLQEQGELHQGAQDVSMADVEAAGDADMVRNGVAPNENDLQDSDGND